MYDVLFQLDRLSKRIEGSQMIDPVEFGEIKGAVASLQLQMTDFKARLAVTDRKLDQILDKLSEAKGGWKTLMLLGGSASTLGGGLTWIITHFYKGTP